MIKTILDVLKSDPSQVQLAILFGSFSRGCATAQSDVDLAVLSRNFLTLDQKLNLTQALGDRLQREIDLVDLSECGPTVKVEAMTQGKVILNLDPFRYAQIMKEFMIDQEDWGRWRDFIRSETRKRIFK